MSSKYLSICVLYHRDCQTTITSHSFIHSFTSCKWLICSHYTKDNTWGRTMSTVTRLLAGNWGIGASFLAIAQTFLMMWHIQTFKCLYTLQEHSVLQHRVLQHLHILHLHCYCWFTANCWCAVCLLLQWTNSTAAAGYQQTLPQKMKNM
jgi:hypothetical protein